MISRTADPAETDPVRIATRLGVPVELVRTLQERVILAHFDLSDREVRERLWQARRRAALPADTPASFQPPEGSRRIAS
jgi:hypothetical protein